VSEGTKPTQSELDDARSRVDGQPATRFVYTEREDPASAENLRHVVSVTFPKATKEDWVSAVASLVASVREFDKKKEGAK
jgi:hypothetical protein